MSFWTSKGRIWWSESWLQTGQHSKPGTRPTIIGSYFQYSKMFEPEPFNIPCGHCAHGVSCLRCQNFNWYVFLTVHGCAQISKLVTESWSSGAGYIQGTTFCTQVSIAWSMYWFVRGSCAFAPKAHYDIVVRLFFLSWISIHSLDSCHLISNCMLWWFGRKIKCIL